MTKRVVVVFFFFLHLYSAMLIPGRRKPRNRDAGIENREKMSIMELTRPTECRSVKIFVPKTIRRKTSILHPYNFVFLIQISRAVLNRYNNNLYTHRLHNIIFIFGIITSRKIGVDYPHKSILKYEFRLEFSSGGGASLGRQFCRTFRVQNSIRLTS